MFMTQIVSQITQKNIKADQFNSMQYATPICRPFIISTRIPLGYQLSNKARLQVKTLLTQNKIHLNCIGTKSYAINLAGLVNVTQFVDGFQFEESSKNKQQVTTLQLSNSTSIYVNEIIGYENYVPNKEEYMQDIEMAVFQTGLKLRMPNGEEIKVESDQEKLKNVLNGSKEILLEGQYSLFIHNIQQEIS